jgi:hypothetical protein
MAFKGCGIVGAASLRTVALIFEVAIWCERGQFKN